MKPICVFITSLLACSVVASGQQAPPFQTPVFRAGADRVRIDVLAHRGGKPIAGLSASDFVVRDNGRLIEDLEVTHTEDRISVVVALDISGSVAVEHMDEMLTATEELVKALRPGDTAWLVTFAGHIELRAGPVRDREAIRTAVKGIRPGGGTSMWDALYASLSLVGTGSARSLALLFTDGLDSTSWSTETQVLDAIRRSDVVFTVVRPRHSIAPMGSPVNYFLNLERAALASGGAILKTERGVKLDRQFVDLLDEFRQGYVLSYSSRGIPPRADGWHQVSIELRGRDGKVRARPGYFEAGR